MRRMLGDNAPVLLPPACFLRDADISQKLLWEGMTIVQPWDMDDIAPEVSSTSQPSCSGICTKHLWLANLRLGPHECVSLQQTPSFACSLSHTAGIDPGKFWLACTSSLHGSRLHQMTTCGCAACSECRLFNMVVQDFASCNLL